MIRHLKSHGTGQSAEVSDGGVCHGEMTGGYRRLPTAVAFQLCTCRGGEVRRESTGFKF